MPRWGTWNPELGVLEDKSRGPIRNSWHLWKKKIKDPLSTPIELILVKDAAINQIRALRILHPERVCRVCIKLMPSLGNFYPDNSDVSGWSYACKKCTKERRKAHRQRVREMIWGKK
jgi:hypothetical protein